MGSLPACQSAHVVEVAFGCLVSVPGLEFLIPRFHQVMKRLYVMLGRCRSVELA